MVRNSGSRTRSPFPARLTSARLLLATAPSALRSRWQVPEAVRTQGGCLYGQTCSNTVIPVSSRVGSACWFGRPDEGELGAGVVFTEKFADAWDSPLEFVCELVLGPCCWARAKALASKQGVSPG